LNIPIRSSTVSVYVLRATSSSPLIKELYKKTDKNEHCISNERVKKEKKKRMNPAKLPKERPGTSFGNKISIFEFAMVAETAACIPKS